MSDKNAGIDDAAERTKVDKNVAQFRDQLKTIVAHGMLSLSIALGLELKLFEALAKTATETNPQCAKVVADAAKCKER